MTTGKIIALTRWIFVGKVMSLFFNMLLDHQKSKLIPEKNIYFCIIDYAKAFDCMYDNELWKILKEMGTPDHLTCLLRNLLAG